MEICFRLDLSFLAPLTLAVFVTAFFGHWRESKTWKDYVT